MIFIRIMLIYKLNETTHALTVSLGRERLDLMGNKNLTMVASTSIGGPFSVCLKNAIQIRTALEKLIWC